MASFDTASKKQVETMQRPSIVEYLAQVILYYNITKETLYV